MSGFSDAGICDAFVYEPKLFGDERGYFFELYRESSLRTVFTDHSFSLINHAPVLGC